VRRGAAALACVAGLAAAAGVAGCGGRAAVAGDGAGGGVPQAHPQIVEPSAGQQAVVEVPTDPVGDPHAHPPSIAQVRAELRLQLVAAKATNTPYINPLRYVSVWERTDQGVDASMPVGAPIQAPCTVKILAIIPDWYAGQPLVYFELLGGVDAGAVQYVAEQITSIAKPGTILTQGQTIAKFAKSGTGIEYGWSTLNGVTLARATTGYEEGQVTPAGVRMRKWLNALGAGAGAS
jgi:hypothetical protein